VVYLKVCTSLMRQAHETSRIAGQIGALGDTAVKRGRVACGLLISDTV
jgi:hypothetical protein